MSVCYIPDRDKILCLVSENIGADKAHWFFFPVLHVSFSLFRFSFILAAFWRAVKFNSSELVSSDTIMQKKVNLSESRTLKVFFVYMKDAS